MLCAVPVFHPEYAGSRVKKQELLLSQQAEHETEESKLHGRDVKTGSRTQGFVTNKR